MSEEYGNRGQMQPLSSSIPGKNLYLCVCVCVCVCMCVCVCVINDVQYQQCDLLGGGHGGDREVTINVKRGVEAKNYGDVSFSRVLVLLHLVGLYCKPRIFCSLCFLFCDFANIFGVNCEYAILVYFLVQQAKKCQK